VSNPLEFEEEEFTTQFNGHTLKRILSLTIPHWPLLVGFLLLICGAAFLDSLFTYLSKRLIDEGIVARDPVALREILTIYGSFILVQALSVFGFIYMAGILGERIRYELRQQLFAHLQKLTLSYYNRTPVGWIMSRLTSDTDRLAELVTWGLLDSAWAIFNIATAIGFMLYINAPLAIIVSLVIPVIVVVAIQFKQRIIVEYRKVRKINSQITGHYNETITGVRVIKALGREEANLAEFGALTGNMYRASFRAAWLSALFLPTVQLISAVGVGMIIWYSGWQVTNVNFLGTTLTVGGIQAFITYVTFMLWPVQEIARIYAEMQQAIASGERIFSLIDAQPEIVDRPGATDPGTLRGDIVFDNVEFYYEADSPVLSNFNLRVNQGETLALVGPTGGGKSTIVNLVCRFFEPKSGEIRINGTDYTQLTQHAIQSRIGVVLQTPHLFSGTIRENIAFGRPDASDEEVTAAAKAAAAHDFILSFPDGYQTAVSERGTTLSGGQKQRLAIARALLLNPRILILDDSTSAVDVATEAQIQAALDRLMQGRTSFVIAQRISTVLNADLILVLDKGKVVAAGRHADLMEDSPAYVAIYRSQLVEDAVAPTDAPTDAAADAAVAPVAV